MLAQNFLSHDVLGITEEEQSALIKVLGMLEREEISPEQFSMGVVDCGTHACLWGWAQRVGGHRVFGLPSTREVMWPDAIVRLFGCGTLKVLRVNDPAKGQLALRNYLTAGEPCWAEVLAAER